MTKSFSQMFSLLFRNKKTLALLVFMWASHAHSEEKNDSPIPKDLIQATTRDDSGHFFEVYGGLFWGLNHISHLSMKSVYDIQDLRFQFFHT